jgi:hypothetical protein
LPDLVGGELFSSLFNIMKKNIIFIIAAFFVFGFLFSANQAFAHQPRMVSGADKIIVNNPEISQAFYATLSGQPQIYEINSDKPFILYSNILTPQIKNATSTNDFSILIYEQKEGRDPGLLEVLAGPKFKWTEFYEPVAGDDYFRGPEFRREVGAGKYLVKVIQPDFKGKYVLAIGEKEKFPIAEIVKAIFVLPQEKKFFEKSVFSIFSAQAGFYFLISTIIIILAALSVWLAIWFVKKRK